jgi:hypothetical protein
MLMAVSFIIDSDVQTDQCENCIKSLISVF